MAPDAGCGTAVDLITGEKHDFGGGDLLPAYSAYFWLMKLTENLFMKVLIYPRGH